LPADLRVVALGGGHGLAASLTALRAVTDRLTAVVTVADDGGSSGRLRREMGALPPGDLRMAVAALAGDDPWAATWVDLVQHRFTGDGPLRAHAVGNLLIVAATQRLGGIVPALDLVCELVHARGRVLPMSVVPLDLVADVAGLDPLDPLAISPVRGQVAVATTPGEVMAVHLEPTDPPACPEAVQAVREADWVVLGPGSWFTSVIPHMLVPELRAALSQTPARRALVLNLSPQDGETTGFTAAHHLEVLAAHAPGVRLDVVLADPGLVGASPSAGGHDAVEHAARALGATVLWRPVARGDGTARHDPQRLAAALREAFSEASTTPDPGAPPVGGFRPWR
jgi:uncharacterized cofD-like protein